MVFMILPGIPATTLRGGTSLVMTLFAPIMEWWPMVIPPKIFAPVAM
jgi:hypothetical protein